MPFLDPDLYPEAWDSALIGPFVTPGLCKCYQGGRELKWEKKPGFGLDGATTKLTGINPGEFTMRIEFWDGIQGSSAIVHRAQYESEILPILKDAESGKTALEFYHPAVSDAPMFCRAVVPQKVGILEQEDSGLWTVTHTFLRFGKVKTATGTPKGAKTKKEGEPVQDANEKKIAELTKELKTLANG